MSSRSTAKPSKLRKAWQWMNGAPWIAFPFRLVVVTAGICAASSMHLLNVAGVDTWLERLELDQMDFSVNTAPPDKLRLIYIGQGDTLPKVNGSFADEGARQLWRREHAHLLQALGNAPRLVAFDLNFPAPNDAKENQQASDEFAKAVREARTRVIVGAELNEQGLPQLIDSLKSAEWGLTQVGGLRLEHGQSKALIRRYVLARSQVPVGTPLVRQPAIPSLAVEMLLVDLSRPSTEPTSVALDTGKSELVLFSGSTELKRISCDIEPEIRNSGDRMPRLLATIPLHYPRTPEFVEEKYAQVLQRLSRVAADYRDKVVLLGARIEGEVAAEEGGELVVLAPKPDERAPAYGYQVHASVYSDLLLDTYPRRLRGVWQLLILLVLGFLSGVGRKILPKSDVEVDTKILGKRNVPIGLLILTGVYAVIVWLFCRSAFIVFDVAYGALAVVASYFLCGSVLIRDRKIGRRGLNDSPG